MRITIASMDARGGVGESVLQAALAASCVVVQTDMCAVLRKRAIDYETLDDLYETTENFDELAEQTSKRIVRDGLLLIVLGEAYLNRIAVFTAKAAREAGGEVVVIPFGDEALCLAMAAGVADGLGGVVIHTAASFMVAGDTDETLVIHEIDTRLAASELKLKLLRCYTDEHQAYIVNHRKGIGQIIPVWALDAEPYYGYYLSIVLPPVHLTGKKRYTFLDLVRIMDKLRGRGGCPWDAEQTHESLRRYLIEEGYEVLEAIDKGDIDALYDELGDVLLQVVFHAKIAQQCGEFDISDVTTAVCAKMISRHTHIFGKAVAETPDAVIENWDQIKRGEKGQSTQAEVLWDVPKSMPALMRSGKVQQKAARAGMDFKQPGDAADKLCEELSEVQSAKPGSAALEEECGDLLFAAVNVARLSGIEPETALQRATDKFIRRFEVAERLAIDRNIDMRTCTVSQLDEIWNEAKVRMKNKA
jgi:tetrapyrrole methylase family protein / MazG family protein